VRASFIVVGYNHKEDNQTLLKPNLLNQIDLPFLLFIFKIGSQNIINRVLEKLLYPNSNIFKHKKLKKYNSNYVFIWGFPSNQKGKI
jgi:hypothetical protein